MSAEFLLVNTLYHFESSHHFGLTPSLSSGVFQVASFPQNLGDLQLPQGSGKGEDGVDMEPQGHVLVARCFLTHLLGRDIALQSFSWVLPN